VDADAVEDETTAAIAAATTEPMILANDREATQVGRTRLPPSFGAL